MVKSEHEARFYLADTRFTDKTDLIEELDRVFGVRKIKDYEFTDFYFLPKGGLRADWHPDIQSMRVRRRKIWTGREPANLILSKRAGKEKEILYETTYKDYESALKRLTEMGFGEWFTIEKYGGVHYEIHTNNSVVQKLHKRRIALEAVKCIFGDVHKDLGVMGEVEVGETDDSSIINAVYDEISDTIGLERSNYVTNSMATIALQRLGIL